MTIAPDTLLLTLVVNVLVLASSFGVLLGRELSAPAQAARWSLLLQAVAWLALMVSGLWPDTWADRLLSTGSMASLGLSQWAFYQALRGWLGPRPFRRVLHASAWLLPVGYFLLFDGYALRVGWANGWIALQAFVLGLAAVHPPAVRAGPWRWVLFAMLSCMAVMTLARGVMGLFFTDLYPYFAAPHPVNLLALVVANVGLIMVNVCVLVAWREEAERELEQMALTDALTGLSNRRSWNERVPGLLAQAQRSHSPVAVLSLDLDHFKKVNDEHGHAVGDAALKLFGTLMAEAVRSSDVVARLGGEEFSICLPRADEAAVRALDQRLRHALLAQSQARLGFVLNYSAGVAFLQPGENLAQLMNRADEALYAAKSGGRGRLSVGPAATGAGG